MGEPVRCLEANDGQDAIRIFDANRANTGGPHGLSGSMTVTEIWDRYYKPVHLVMADSRPNNYVSIEESIGYWARFTGDPPIDSISVYHSRDFVVGLKALPGRKYPTMANNTVRKHCGAIQTILDLCGRASRENRGGLGLIDEVPYIPRPPKQKASAEGCYTLEELQRLCECAGLAMQPKKINGRPIVTAVYYRRIYALIFNTGIRIGGVLGSTWRNFHGDHLILPARIAVKGHEDKRVELNDQAREVIEAMRGYDAERIFPWPAKDTSRRNLYTRGHDLIRQGLPENRRKFFAFHALRRLHNNELAGINSLACMKSLGHSSGRTTVEHYTSTRLVVDAVAKLPKVPINGDPQQRLFD